LGALVLFSAGNSNGAVSYPATLNTVLAIGALSPCGERKAPTSCDGEFWWGSNYGAELDLMAPGVNMYSTDIQGAAGYDPGDYYYNFNGTSSAAPAAAGVAALVVGYEPYLTAAEVESRLKSTARDLGAPGWDQYTGWGLVNAYQALTSVCPADLVLDASDNGTASLYQASNSVTAGNGFTVGATENVTFEAGNFIRLVGGFSVVQGATFTAKINPSVCK
jgi:subtilisin family serine protease